MSNQIFPTGSQTAYQRYVQQLSSAMLHRDWIYDPSYALKTDSDVYRKVMRDPVAAHALRYRRHLIAGPEWRIEPASDAPEDRAAAEIVEELINNIHGFTDARICLAEAVVRGSAWAFMEGERRFTALAGDDTPRAWWTPGRLADVDRRRFRQVKGNVWEFWSVENEDWEPLNNPEWFIRSTYDATEDSLGYGRGLLDTIYFFQAAKSKTFQDSMNAVERFGQGFITAAIDNLRGDNGRGVGGVGKTSAKVATAWKDSLVKHRADNVLVHDKRDEIKLVQGIGEGWQLLRDFMAYLDTSQVTAILGSNLPTQASEGGSFALAQVQENSTEALVQADRSRMSDDLTRDLVGACWNLNRLQFAEAGLSSASMPRFRIIQQKREDPQVEAQIAQILLQSGVDLRKDELYRKVGYTTPMPEDEVVGSPSFAGELSSELIDIGETDTDLSQPDSFADTALNGAQITAANELIQSVATKALPPSAVIEMLVSFLNIDRTIASRIVGSVESADLNIEEEDRSNGNSFKKNQKPITRDLSKLNSPN